MNLNESPKKAIYCVNKPFRFVTHKEHLKLVADLLDSFRGL